MRLFTVIMTFCPQEEWQPVPVICYTGKDPALFFSDVPAKELVRQLTEHNPGCIYEVKEIV